MSPLPHGIRPKVFLLAAVLLASPTMAETRLISIPNYRVQAGQELEVPLQLDNAAGLASLQVQINFNRQVIELTSVRPGPLGNLFEMTRGDGDGFTQLTFVRAQALHSGEGHLAILKFRANAQAAVDLQSELTIANTSLSDATGVVDLRRVDSLTLANGRVSVSAARNIDNADNGLPDWWELQHGFDPFSQNRADDTDQDGLTNFLEYAFGGNPREADSWVRGVHGGRVESSGATFLKAGFFRRHGHVGLVYRVQESPDLTDWHDLELPARFIGSPQNMGDGTEYVEVQSTRQITGPDAEPKGFMRVVVEKD